MSPGVQLVWLVTGASRGLGLALLKRILARGDCVIATARQTGRLDPLLSQPDTDKTRIFVLELDVTWSFEVLQETARRAVERWGRVDVIVHNATYNPLSGMTEEFGAAMFLPFLNTNLLGPINVNNSFLPHMRARSSGTIELIGSRSVYRNQVLARSFTIYSAQNYPLTLAILTIKGIGPYAASKAALHSYGETLSVELAPFNIRVLIVAPGQFDTAAPLQVHIPVNPVAGYNAPYDTLREALQRRIEDRQRTPNKGDPKKGMDALADVVRGEGGAEGKGGEMPLWLFLGDDAISDVKARVEKLKDTAEEWEDVGTRLGVDDP